MNTQITEFLEHLRFERRLSEHTVAAYRADLAHFHDFIKTRLAGDDILGCLNHHHLREYLSFCCHRYKNVSIARRLSGLRTFLRFMVRRGHIKSSPAMLIENPQIKKPLPKPVSVDEAFRLCDFGASAQKGIEFRNQLVCELLYASGVRVSELCGLNIDQIDLTARLIRVMGKGKKERIVPIHQKCAELLRLWLSVYRIELVIDPDEKALLLGERGSRLHPRVVRAVLSRLGQSLGINNSLHPHRLRHAYATHMLESGADLRGIQELLGHATISTTERYTEIDLASLMKQYDGAHPHSKKKA